MTQTRAFIGRIQRYWNEFGGWKGALLSPLFLTALFVALISYRMWQGDQWRQTTLALLPNLLGFSLGTYAILFSLMTNRLKRSLRAVCNDRGVPFLREINATFFHFIFVQVVALIWALGAASTLIDDLSSIVGMQAEIRPILRQLSLLTGGVGTLLLAYSVTLIIGAALVIYRIASIVDPRED